MSDGMYTRCYARLTVDGKTYYAEIEITPTADMCGSEVRGDIKDLVTELELANKLQVFNENYKSYPLSEPQPLKEGTLEIGWCNGQDQHRNYPSSRKVKVDCQQIK